MNSIRTVYASITMLAISTSVSQAEICDYRPTKILGGSGAVAGATAGSVAAAGVGAKAAGVYTLVHATSGLTMVGGTWAGASAAGTAGILAGTGGAAGTAVAVLTAPATIVVGSIAAIVTGSFEGACYFSDDRITDYDEINAIVADIAVTAPHDLYRYYPGPLSGNEAMIEVRTVDSDDKDPRYDVYRVKNLYIVNGMLKNKDWGRNTEIGLIGEIQ